MVTSAKASTLNPFTIQGYKGFKITLVYTIIECFEKMPTISNNFKTSIISICLSTRGEEPVGHKPSSQTCYYLSSVGNNA